MAHAAACPSALSARARGGSHTGGPCPSRAAIRRRPVGPGGLSNGVGGSRRGPTTKAAPRSPEPALWGGVPPRGAFQGLDAGRPATVARGGSGWRPPPSWRGPPHQLRRRRDRPRSAPGCSRSAGRLAHAAARTRYAGAGTATATVRARTGDRWGVAAPTATALAPLTRLRQRGRRCRPVRRAVPQLWAAHLEQAGTFRDDARRPSPSQAVERRQRRHRQRQTTLSRVRPQEHLPARIARAMLRDARKQDRQETRTTLHSTRAR